MQKCHWQEIIFIAVIFCYKQKVILTAKRRGDSLPNKFHNKVGTWICSLWMLRITGQSNEISNFPFSHQSDQPGQPMYLNISGLGIRSSVFWANRLFLPKNKQMCDSLKKTSDSLIRSFLVNDLSDLHTIAHFQSCPSGEQKSCVSPYKVWSCYWPGNYGWPSESWRYC